MIHSLEEETAQTSQPWSCSLFTNSRISGKTRPGNAHAHKLASSVHHLRLRETLVHATISPHISSSLTLLALYST